LGQLFLAVLGLHAVLLAVALLGRGGVVPAAVEVLVEAVPVGVARVRPLGHDPVGLEDVVDAHLARLLAGAARVLVLAGLGEQVELGIVGGVLRLCHGVLLEGQLRASMIAALKASRSSGVREVMRRKPAESSTTTSSSAQRPPALTRSVRMVGTEVSSRPSARPVSTSSQGAWQIAATGLPSAAKARARNCAVSSPRGASALRGPPGSTRASTSAALTESCAASTRPSGPGRRSRSRVAITPVSGAATVTVAPASRRAAMGPRISSVSVPKLLLRSRIVRP